MRGGGGIAAAALAFLAAFLLAPGEARAADECGAISSTAQTVTCSDTTYADGIIYQNAAPGANNVATVKVPGGSTAWTVTSGAGSTRASNGITLDSDGAAGGGLALTVGGASATANRVAIRQRASNANSGTEDNNGILIIQQRTGASTTTLTVNAGVTIGEPVGTGAGRMNRHGILARVNAGSGAATFTNHAAIHSTLEGIRVLRSSNAGTRAATTINNYGAISSGAEGIYLNYLAATSNAHTGGATINNHGAITTSGATQDGILMEYKNRGDAKIANTGPITATQSGSNGISLQHTGAAGGATVTNSGNIMSHALAISVLTSIKTAAGTTAGASVIHEGGAINVSNQAGILVTVGEEGEPIANAGDAEITVTGGSVEARDEALLARNRQAGNVVITVSEGVTLTSRTKEGILGDLPSSNVVGGVTITNEAEITAAKVGILVRRMAPANDGNISITNRGAIKRTGGDVDFAGIRVEDDRGKGHVTVMNSGDIGEAGAMAMYLHGIQVQKTASSGDLSVTTTGGSITAKDRGIYVTDNAGHTGAVTISNGGNVTADRPIYVNRNGAGPVTITNTGGTVRTESSHAIYAYNKTGDASDVRVNVEGGTVQSSRSALNFAHVNVVHAFNRGTGDVIVDVADGATLISRVSEAVYANLDSTTLAPDNQVKITQGGRMMGRTGVYARAGGYGVAAEGEEAAARAEGNPDVIDVTWTGSFSHGTTEAEKAMVAQNDEGRFSAANVSDLVVFSQYVEAERATDGLYGSAAGVEAAVMPRRIADSTGILQVVAAGDVPGEFPDAAAQTALLAETGDASRRTAILAQFRAMLGNEEIDAASVLTAIDPTATTVADLSDEEILNYLGAGTPGARVNLYNGLFGLSVAEKKVLKAVATGGDVDAALRDAGFTDDPDDDEDYWSTVMALLDRYNPGNIKVAMNDGSIDSRGDGIRAYYATPHANNGAINVTVAEGTTVTGARAGVHVANAGTGLMLARRYTSGYAQGDTADELVAVTYGEGADAVALRNQLVTVAGTVTGGTDAAVHLNGGGAVLVMEGGKVHAGASGVAIKVNDPGPALVYVGGEVKGGAGPDGAPAPAAVHLTGGGSVTVGLNGRVQANGAAHAIRGGGEATMVALTLVTPSMYREDAAEAIARVEGGYQNVENVVRLREDRDGVPTGYSMPLPVTADGTLDTSGLPLRPCPEGQTRGADGGCETPIDPIDPSEPGMGPGTGTGTGTDTDLDGIRVVFTGGGGIESRDDGIRAEYKTPHDDNDAIRVTVAAGTTVTGSMDGIYVANAGTGGLTLPRRYTYGYAKDDDPDELVEVEHGEGEEAAPLRNQRVTVHGTVTGGTVAAVHLSGGGAVIVGEGGRVHAGASGVGILVNDPGPALVYVDGEVKGGAGGAAAVHLTGGGSVIVGLNGSVQANGAAHALRSDGEAAATLTLVTGDVILYREDAEEAHARVEGSTKGIGDVRFREDRDGVPTGYSRTLPYKDDGTLDTSGLDPRLGAPEPSGPEPVPPFSCAGAMDGRCGMYEALPSMLLAMNALPSWAERTAAARDGNGGWARVETVRGKWQAKKAATPGELAYDHRRSAGQAGIDFLAGESGRVGVSVHALGGKAQMSGVGEVELNAMGGGVSATWLAGDLYVDAQAAVTLYDVDVESYRHGKMPKKDVGGTGYGLGVDVGKRTPVGRTFVTPRAGVAWSKVALDDFTDMETDGDPSRVRVSVGDASSVKGRLGVMVETEVGSGESSGRLFGSLDVEREFSDETEVKVGGEMLKTEVRPTAVRLGAGGVFEMDENVVVRATAGYRTSGSGTSGYGGGLELHVRF